MVVEDVLAEEGDVEDARLTGMLELLALCGRVVDFVGPGLPGLEDACPEVVEVARRVDVLRLGCLLVERVFASLLDDEVVVDGGFFAAFVVDLALALVRVVVLLFLPEVDVDGPIVDVDTFLAPERFLLLVLDVVVTAVDSAPDVVDAVGRAVVVLWLALLLDSSSVNSVVVSVESTFSLEVVPCSGDSSTAALLLDVSSCASCSGKVVVEATTPSPLVLVSSVSVPSSAGPACAEVVMLRASSSSMSSSSSSSSEELSSVVDIPIWSVVVPSLSLCSSLVLASEMVPSPLKVSADVVVDSDADDASLPRSVRVLEELLKLPKAGELAGSARCSALLCSSCGATPKADTAPEAFLGFISGALPSAGADARSVDASIDDLVSFRSNR